MGRSLSRPSTGRGNFHFLAIWGSRVTMFVEFAETGSGFEIRFFHERGLGDFCCELRCNHQSRGVGRNRGCCLLPEGSSPQVP